VAETLTEDQQYDATIDYMCRNPFVSYEESEELHGIRCVDEIPILDVGGMVVGRSTLEHYAKPLQRDLTPEALHHLMMELGCSAEEAEAYWHKCMKLVRSGRVKSWENAEIQATAAVGSRPVVRCTVRDCRDGTQIVEPVYG
jgi:hypothetical protein